MPQLVALLPLIFGGVGAATGVGEAIAGAVGSKPSTSAAPSSVTPPAVPTTPQTPAPQISADQSNYQANTGNSVSPDFLQTLLSGGSLSPTGPYST